MYDVRTRSASPASLDVPRAVGSFHGSGAPAGNEVAGNDSLLNYNASSVAALQRFDSLAADILKRVSLQRLYTSPVTGDGIKNALKALREQVPQGSDHRINTSVSVVLENMDKHVDESMLLQSLYILHRRVTRKEPAVAPQSSTASLPVAIDPPRIGPVHAALNPSRVPAAPTTIACAPRSISEPRLPARVHEAATTPSAAALPMWTSHTSSLHKALCARNADESVLFTLNVLGTLAAMAGLSQQGADFVSMSERSTRTYPGTPGILLFDGIRQFTNQFEFPVEGLEDKVGRLFIGTPIGEMNIGWSFAVSPSTQKSLFLSGRFTADVDAIWNLSQAKPSIDILGAWTHFLRQSDSEYNLTLLTKFFLVHHQVPVTKIQPMAVSELGSLFVRSHTSMLQFFAQQDALFSRETGETAIVGSTYHRKFLQNYMKRMDFFAHMAKSGAFERDLLVHLSNVIETLSEKTEFFRR